jgi:hypothetical protein
MTAPHPFQAPLAPAFCVPRPGGEPEGFPRPVGFGACRDLGCTGVCTAFVPALYRVISKPDQWLARKRYSGTPQTPPSRMCAGARVRMCECVPYQRTAVPLSLYLYGKKEEKVSFRRYGSGTGEVR